MAQVIQSQKEHRDARISGSGKGKVVGGSFYLYAQGSRNSCRFNAHRLAYSIHTGRTGVWRPDQRQDRAVEIPVENGDMLR